MLVCAHLEECLDKVERVLPVAKNVQVAFRFSPLKYELFWPAYKSVQSAILHAVRRAVETQQIGENSSLCICSIIQNHNTINKHTEKIFKKKKVMVLAKSIFQWK